MEKELLKIFCWDISKIIFEYSAHRKDDLHRDIILQAIYNDNEICMLCQCDKIHNFRECQFMKEELKVVHLMRSVEFW